MKNEPNERMEIKRAKKGEGATDFEISRRRRKWQKDKRKSNQIKSNFLDILFRFAGDFLYVHGIKYYMEYNVLCVSERTSERASHPAS